MGTETGILDEIRKAEDNCREKIEQARVDATKIVSDALKKAEEISTRYEEEGKKSADLLIETNRKKIQEEGERILSAARIEIENIKKQGEASAPAAILFLKKKITGT
ncbi:MAG: hypothetical protein JXA44_04460 [Methanospirillaceae archaeon]|nr:hypothetical protein [Methanospirillaceae archaeon]